jgi:BNR/Asp-box repeat
MALSMDCGRVFLDETTAWVIPGSGFDTSGTLLLRTLDGGKSWQKFMIPGETFEITFVDKQNGWATDVAQKGQNAMDQELAIFHTADGGKTWKLMSKAQTGTTNTTPGPFPTGQVGSGTFLNSKTGWFVRGSMLIAGHGSAYRALYITHDGGKSWQLQQLPQSGEIIPAPNIDSGDKVVAVISQPRFFNAQHGSLLVYVNDQEKIHIYLYSTDDGGQIWQLTGNKFSTTANKNAMVPIIVTLIDATHFLLLEKNEIDIYELTGGQWQEKYKMTGGQFNNYGNVNFINGQTGWLVANRDVIVDKKTKDQTFTSVIYTTSNGGKSWQKIQQGSYVLPGNTPQG